MSNNIVNFPLNHNLKLSLDKTASISQDYNSLSQQYHRKIEDAIIRALNDFHFSTLVLDHGKKRGYRDLFPITLRKTCDVAISKISKQKNRGSYNCPQQKEYV